MYKQITHILVGIIFIFLFIFYFSSISKIWATQEQPSLTPTPIPSVEYNLPYPGILPDHSLYFFKIARDNILLWLTRDLSKKSQLYLLFADKHLGMGQLLWEKGSLDLSISTFSKGEKYLLDAAVTRVKLKHQNNLLVGEADKLDFATQKHKEVLTKILNLAPNETSRQRLLEIVGITNQAIQQVSLLK